MKAIRFASSPLINKPRKMLFTSLAAKMFRVISLVTHADTLPIEDGHLASVAEEPHALVVVFLAVGLPIFAGEEAEHAKRLWALGAFEATLMPGLVHSVNTSFATLDILPAAGTSGMEDAHEVCFAVGVVVITFANFGTIAKIFVTYFAAKMSWMPGHSEGVKYVTVGNGLVTGRANFHDDDELL